MGKGIWLLLLVFGLLYSCQQIPGTFTVYQQIGLYYSPNNNPQEEHIFQINPGTYQGTIKWLGQYEANLVIPQMPIFRFVLKDSGRFPGEGNFVISPEQNNQGREIWGRITKKVVDGPITHDRETCTYVRYDSICDETSCYIRRQVFWGMQEVEYLQQTIETVAILKLANLDATDVDMAFAGKSSHREKKYLFQGPCGP